MRNEARQPRGMVFVNGIRIAWLEIEVNNNAYYQADSFRVVLPAKGQPAQVTRTWWMNQNPIVVDIYMGFPADVNNYTKDDLKLMITGEADEFPHKLVEDTITLCGRDFTSYMIDTKILASDKLNRTASDCVIEIAEKYALTTDFVVPTTTKIGTIYELNFTKMQREITEWDFLCLLAQELDFQVHVDGYDLHFEPKSDNPPIYPIVWKDEDQNGVKQFDARELTFIRNMTIARDIIVYLRVISMKGKPFTVKSTASYTRKYDKVLNKGRRFTGQTQKFYQKRKEHMDKGAAQAEADRIAKDIAQHQMKMLIDGMPGDNILTIKHVLRLTGTKDYDQDFWCDSIVRTLSMKDGYTMNVFAKNHDPNTEVPVI